VLKLFRVAPFREYHEAGFTIIEVLVALAIVAASLASIGALIATSTRWSHVLERHVELIETARAVKSALPKHDQLAIGDFSGELAGHSWRVNVLPFAAGGIDPELPSPWLPRTIAITVRSPTGAAFQLTTVRLHRRTKE
jgi:general secretion pathway protein I